MARSKPCACGQRRCTRSAACLGSTTVREGRVDVTYVQMNANGLTFERWYAAATFGARVRPLPETMLAAWRAGEDPTDHAASLA